MLDIEKLELEYENIGVKLRDDNGKIKPLEVLLEDFAKKWRELEVAEVNRESVVEPRGARRKLGLLEEASQMFGEMCPTDPEVQKSIEEYYEKTSENTGLNMLDMLFDKPIEPSSGMPSVDSPIKNWREHINSLK